MPVSISDTSSQVRRVLSRALRAATLKQSDLARAAGITPYSFRQYWYGRRTPKPDVLKRIAKALRGQGGELLRLARELKRAAARTPIPKKGRRP